MATTTLARFAPSFLLLAAACGPVNGNRESGYAPGSSEAPAVDANAPAAAGAGGACPSAVWCTDGSPAGGGAAQVAAHHDGCWMGNIRLDAAGGVNGGSADAGTEFWVQGWTGPDSTFSVCASDGCLLTCSPYVAPADPEPSTAAGGSRCTGWGAPCESFVPGGCAVQPGCYMQSNYQLDGTVTFSCAGSPDWCDSASDDSECTSIVGCTWK